MKKLYQETFDEIHASEALRQEVMNLTRQERRSPRRHRLPAAMLAAVLVVIALMGTAVATLAVPGSIQEWFARQWGSPMEKGQTELIDRLTQEIGVSDTDNGITVTVDSATIGDSVLWLLLKAEGQDLQPFQHDDTNPEYFVQGLKCKLTPEGEGEEVVEYGFDLPFAGAGEDGTLMLLLRFLPVMPEGQSLAGGAYRGELHMEGLQKNDGQKTDIFRGTWDFSFTLEPTEDRQALSVGAITVSGERLEPRETVEVELQNVEVTSTGFCYTMAEEENPEFKDMIHILSGNWKLELQDGSELSHNGGVSHWSPENGGQRITHYYWLTPIDLTQVKALWFGDDCYPLS